MYVRKYVRPLPDVQRCGIPIDLNITKRRYIVVVLSYLKVGAEQQLKATIAWTAGSRHAWLGRGDSGWATTELRLNNYDYCAKPGPGLRWTAVATAAEQLPVCACRAKQTACWMSRQIQVNSRDNCHGVATSSARQLQWYLPPDENRMPLKGVTVSQSLYLLTPRPQSRGPAPLLLRVGVAHETTNTVG